MKKNNFTLIALCISFICFTVITKAQTGLQFIQVKHYDLAPSPNGTVAVSVPAGKVWKIESVSMGSLGTPPSVLLKNSSSQNIAFFSSRTNVSSAAFPYWLPSSFTGTFSNNNPSYRCSISITEYTVVP